MKAVLITAVAAAAVAAVWWTDRKLGQVFLSLKEEGWTEEEIERWLREELKLPEWKIKWGALPKLKKIYGHRRRSLWKTVFQGTKDAGFTDEEATSAAGAVASRVVEVG